MSNFCATDPQGCDLGTMTTSQKHRDFVAEPMGEKEVNALAGIGDVLGKRLQDKGFDKVIFFCHFARNS